MYDLQAHLDRIQYQGNIDVSLAVLNDLHRCSTFHIPFENFDVHLQKQISLDKDKIFTKLVKQKRGGYCYELNGLFYDLLTHIGFQVSYLIARPMLGYTHTRPKTHMLLMVELEQQKYLCDLGFSGMSLLEPLKLQLDTAVSQYHQQFKLISDDKQDYQLQTLCHGNWVSLFSFNLQQQQYIDFELANYFNSNSPQSICVTSPIASIYTQNGRVRLINDSIKVRTETRTIIELRSVDQVAEKLQEYFNLNFSVAELESLFKKMKR